MVLKNKIGWNPSNLICLPKTLITGWVNHPVIQCTLNRFGSIQGAAIVLVIVAMPIINNVFLLIVR